jgi:hypothetical protein
MKEAEITKLLDEVRSVLKRDKRSVADLARDISRNYHHVYDWVCRRRFNPRPEGLKLLHEWLANEGARASAEFPELKKWIAERGPVESVAYYWFRRCRQAEERLKEISRIARFRS